MLVWISGSEAGQPVAPIPYVDAQGVQYPPNMESLWTAAELAAINMQSVAAPVEPQVNWTFLQFMGLFTSAEQVAIFTARKTDVQTDMFITMAAGAGQLQLSNPEVVQGVDYLVTAGLVTSARATAILAGQSPS